jgi:DNA replication protein DnaC
MASQTSNFSPAPRADHRESLRETCAVADHGSFVNALVEQFDGSWLAKGCPRCNWAALNTDPVESASHKAAKARRTADRLNVQLIGSGITPRFHSCTLDTFVTDGEQAKVRALATCRTYVDRFEDNYRDGRSMILSGNVGTGKTHLASAMAQAVIRQHGAKAVIVTIAEIVRVAKGTMAKGATYDERDVINELAGADLLIIDEIGAQRGTDYEVGLIHETIDRRYQLVVPTVAVSNLLVEDLKAYIGERALDRLRQGGGKAVGFTWESARGRA